jgi:shikimate kinase
MTKIFFVGYMAAGKSSVGKELAANLKLKFIDLDHFVENEMGMSIPEIFSSKGENAFRAAENNALKKLIQTNDFVIACGGGTPCYYNNMELMNNNGITVYLKHSSETLFERLKSNKTERPIIANKKDEELLQFIKRQLEKREAFYHQALYTIKDKKLNVKDCAELIGKTIDLKN